MNRVCCSRTILAGIILGLLLAVIVTGVLPSAAPAYAADPTSTPTAPFKPGKLGKGGRSGDKVVDPARLEFHLKREQIALTAQQERINRMGEIAAAVQSLIDAEKSAGKNTSGLEAALAAFKQQITAAQAPHDNAKSILDAKAGFDANGAVTDATQARQTLKTAAQSLKDAHQIISQATKDLRKTYREYIQTNRPIKTGQTTAQAGQ